MATTEKGAIVDLQNVDFTRNQKEDLNNLLKKSKKNKNVIPIFNGRKSIKVKLLVKIKNVIERLDVSKNRSYKFGIKMEVYGSGEKVYIPVVKEGNISSWTRICKVENGEYFAIDLPVQVKLTRKECNDYIEAFKLQISKEDDDKLISSDILEPTS